MGYSRETIKGTKPDSGNVDGAVATISKLLQDTDAPRVARAGTAYAEGANRLKTLVEALEKVNQLLADEWHGKDAVTAQKNLQQMHATARHLRGQMAKFGEQLFAYGNDYLPYFRDSAFASSGATWNDDLSVGDWKTYSGKDARYTGEKAGHELVVTGSANGIAQTHLKMLNQRMVELWEKMPDILTSDLPEIPPAPIGTPSVQAVDYGRDHRPGTSGNPGGPNGGLNGLGNKDGHSGLDGLDDSGKDSGDLGGKDGTGDSGKGGNGDPGRGTGDHPGKGGSDGSGNPGQTDVPGGKDGNASGQPDGTTTTTTGATPTSVTDPTKGSRGTDLSQFQQPKLHPTTFTDSTPHWGNQSPTSGGTPTGAIAIPNALGAGVDEARMTRLASAGASTMPFVPMTPGHGGEEQQAPDGTGTWLHEEDDVWGTDTPDARDHLIA
ncbi:hypothetical protein [Nonomuraea sediminis]|uniref:hypothetical protein n=1 Tax=Nonomuraea sediminis TaxID=2835864 RepID=UPI001BDDBD3F|nr:hypothetical protein [Nonomuraea sediminis]